MTTNSKKNEAEETKREIEDIFRRVDALPVEDSRAADEILGYDENGLPQSEDPKCAAERTGADADRVPKPVQDFLKHRHRDWER